MIQAWLQWKLPTLPSPLCSRPRPVWGSPGSSLRASRLDSDSWFPAASSVWCSRVELRVGWICAKFFPATRTQSSARQVVRAVLPSKANPTCNTTGRGFHGSNCSTSLPCSTKSQSSAILRRARTDSLYLLFRNISAVVWKAGWALRE